MASNIKLRKFPLFRIEYHENEGRVGFPVEMYKLPMMIDGLFEPYKVKNRYSLGFSINPNRKPESLECLINIGLGIQFFVDDTFNFQARSFSKQPIYIYFRKIQYKLDMGEIIAFYDLNSLYEHKILPKKVGKVYEEFGIKLSFGQPFKKVSEDVLVSPCWVDMPLNRIVENLE